MVVIDTTQQTVKAIYDHYESTRTDWRRPHLGASLIGHPCDRYLWYTFRWCKAPEFPGRILRLFDTGNREEERIVQDLRNVGVEVYDRDPKNPKYQIRYSDPECGGHFSGSLDGMGRGFEEAPKAWHVLEFKTSNKNQFEKLEKQGVEKAKPQHYAQMQCYMAWSGVNRAFYFCVCKDDDKIYGERIKANPDTAKALSVRAKKIIFASEPPEKPKNEWDCKYCQFKPLCSGEELPEVNCRTCAHSTPGNYPSDSIFGGIWKCERFGVYKKTDEQKDEFCKDHIYIPALVPMDVADVDPDAGTVTYADGTVNGPGGVSSREMIGRYNNH